MDTAPTKVHRQDWQSPPRAVVLSALLALAETLPEGAGPEAYYEGLMAVAGVPELNRNSHTLYAINAAGHAAAIVRAGRVESAARFREALDATGKAGIEDAARQYAESAAWAACRP